MRTLYRFDVTVRSLSALEDPDRKIEREHYELLIASVGITSLVEHTEHWGREMGFEVCGHGAFERLRKARRQEVAGVVSATRIDG